MEPEIRPIQEVQYSFSNFLWKELTLVYELMALDNYYKAFKIFHEAMFITTEEFQNIFEFRKKCDEYWQQLHEIKSTSPNIHRRTIDVEAKRNMEAQKILYQLLPEFGIKLDKKGYMEKQSIGPRLKGAAHLE